MDLLITSILNNNNNNNNNNNSAIIPTVHTNNGIRSAPTLIGFTLIIAEIKFTIPRNCLLHDASEGQITDIKGVRRRTQLLEVLSNRTRCTRK